MATIRGSVGGLTYTANQHAQIVMKNRIAPVQPNTGLQTAVRSALNEASVKWELLTPAQRADWELYALTVTYIGPQGSYHLTGRQIFIAGYSQQVYALSQGLSAQILNSTPPTISGKLVLGSIFPQPGPNPGTGIGFDIHNPGSEAIGVQLNISPPQNQTRMRYKGPWDTGSNEFFTILAATTVTHTIDSLVDEKAYFVRIKAHTLSTPARISSAVYLRAIAETLP